MNFSDPRLVEQMVWEMKRADYPRAANRAQIDRLFDGFPPWTNEEQNSAQINTNVNFLDGPKLAADARRSYYNAFLKPANFFTATLVDGPQEKRGRCSAVVTKEVNRIMKASVPYFEVVRSQMASTVLHGIGPVHWCDKDRWKPRSVAVGDLLIPSGTLLTQENLNVFAIWRRYTAAELSEMISGPNVDPAWNVEMARAAISWVVKQPLTGRNTAWDTLSPEKIVEQIKQDGVYYGTDTIPTIDCWDVYWYHEEGKENGWRRGIILDTPPQGEFSVNTKPQENKVTTRDLGMSDTGWLYYGGDRIYAEKANEILHFQFGDLSATSPFRYHSVRSLGFLIYAVCNLQNRLRCKLNDHTFENMLNYFRVANAEDADRLTKIDLHNYGLVPDGVQFVTQQDRWQINQALVAGTMQDNRNMMNEAAAQFREGRDTAGTREKTATEIMAEVNSANAMVGTMLLLGYIYQKAQYKEIFKRFLKDNSSDPEVKEFQENVKKEGISKRLLDPEKWTVEPEQVLGSGNKILQVAMADKLMAVRQLLDPEAKREVLRMYVQANSDDPNLATRWVPTEPILVTESVHNAELMIGSLMAGVKVQPRRGQEPEQMVVGLMGGLSQIIAQITNTGTQPDMDKVTGIVNVMGAIDAYLQLAAEDDGNKDLVSQVQADLQEILQVVQEWMQALQQQRGQEDQVDPKVAKELALTEAKVQSMLQETQAKIEADNLKNEQRIQQREAQFQQKMAHNEESHAVKLGNENVKTDASIANTDAKVANEIQNERIDTIANTQKPPQESNA